MRYLRILLIGLVITIGSVAISVAINDISAEDDANLVTTQDKSLDSPMGVASDGKNIYVANANQHNISIFDQSGKLLKIIGQEGISPGQFQYPVDVALSSQGKIYVADLNNFRIQVFSKDGEFESYFPKENQIKPVAISLDKNSNIIVSDILSQTIKVYKPNGELEKEFGGYGEEEGKFRFANGVAASNDGNIYVSDSQNMRIQVFTNDGKFLKSFKPQSEMGLSKGISIYKNQLYVTDTLLQKVHIFNLDGKHLKTISEKEIAFNFPSDVYVTSKRVYVANRTSDQVISFNREDG